MDAFDQLDKTFDISPEELKPIKKPRKKDLVISDKSEDREKDYSYVRSNLYDLVDKMQEACYDALEVAQQSEHPRAFEVAMNGMKNAAEVVEKITDLHAKEKILSSDEQKPAVGGSVQNNMFVGSTADLMKMLKENK